MKCLMFNPEHPEQRDGEVFLCNSTVDDYSDIRFTSKRRGQTAYDWKDNPIRSMFPVFVKRDEVTAKGIDPDHLFKL